MGIMIVPTLLIQVSTQV